MIKGLLPANLKNSFSLLAKLLVSGNRIAVFQIVLYAVSMVTLPIDLLLSKACKHKGAIKGKKPTLFLSGYSRSGTTMIYQALVASLTDTEYINNLVILFPKSYPLITSWYRKICGKRDLGLENYYGRTMGLYGTNDGAQLMNLFWGNDFTGDLDSKQQDCLLNFFQLHSALLNKPLIFKNCNLYLKFATLLELFPNDIFVFVKRDPAATCLSTLKARQFIQGTMDCDWEFSISRVTGDYADPVEEIMRNIKYAYDLIDSLGDRVIVINYEDFCKDPSRLIHMIGGKMDVAVSAATVAAIKKDIHPSKPFNTKGELERRILNARRKFFQDIKTP